MQSEVTEQCELLMKSFPNDAFIVTNRNTCGLNGFKVVETSEIYACKMDHIHLPIRVFISHDNLYSNIYPWINSSKDMTNISERVHFLRIKLD
jgi:hypothetical protein